MAKKELTAKEKQIVSEIAPYLGVPAQAEWEQPSYMKRAIETSLNAKKR